jgi:hypothetical protein
MQAFFQLPDKVSGSMKKMMMWKSLSETDNPEKLIIMSEYPEENECLKRLNLVF